MYVRAEPTELGKAFLDHLPQSNIDPIGVQELFSALTDELGNLGMRVRLVEYGISVDIYDKVLRVLHPVHRSATGALEPFTMPGVRAGASKTEIREALVVLTDLAVSVGEKAAQRQG